MRESAREIARAALAAGWQQAHRRWGSDPSLWSYEELHPLTLRHPIGRAPVLGRHYDRGPYPMAGSATTVAAFGGGWRDDEIPVRYGPSMRWMTEPGAGDRTYAVLPGGQSGHPWDPHYDDQLELFLDNRVHESPWSAEAIRAATVSTLELEPADGP